MQGVIRLLMDSPGSYKAPRRKGWFPINKSELIASSLLRIGKDEDKPLVPAAINSLIDLIAAAEQPPPRQWHWEGELPAMVADSHQNELRPWKEKCEEEEAVKDKQDAGRDMSDKCDTFICHEDPTEHKYPWVICKAPFAPPKEPDCEEWQLHQTS